MRPINAAVTSISAFFPCYNDEATIEPLVETTLATFDSLGVHGEVIVVDDGSRDGSAEILEKLAAREVGVRVVTHPVNRGYGGALASGFRAATESWVFYTDGDGQYDPAELTALVERAGDEVDVVQGYKLSRADGTFRRVVGQAYHSVVARLFGLRVRDVDCDFRLVRRSLLERIELTRTSGAICVELLRKLQDQGARFVEVGVHHYPREHGSSQFFRPVNVLRTLRELATLWFEGRGHRPALGRTR